MCPVWQPAQSPPKYRSVMSYYPLVEDNWRECVRIYRNNRGHQTSEYEHTGVFRRNIDHYRPQT